MPAITVMTQCPVNGAGMQQYCIAGLAIPGQHSDFTTGYHRVEIGKVDEAWVANALALPFFALPPPKSLDRNDFAGLMLGEMTPADGAATLTAFTAASIARIVPLLPKPPRSWIVAGGGARNHTMMRMLRERLAPATVEAADALGWSSDAIEAQAFGFLAARGMKGLPLSYPATTGVPMPMTGGVIARP